MNMTKTEILQEKLMLFTAKVQSNHYVQSVTNGMMGSMGVLIGGTIINLLVNLPITPWTDFLTSIGLMTFLQEVVKIFQLTTPILCFLIAYQLAGFKEVDRLQTGVAAFMSFLLVAPATFDESGNGSLLFNSLNGQTISTAIVVALLCGTLFAWAIKKNFVIKMPDSIPAFVKSSLSNIPAACITIFPFVILRFAFSLTSFQTFPGFVNAVVAAPLGSLGNSIGGHLVFLFMSSLVWWFGIHNMPVLIAAMIAMTPATQANTMANMSNQPLPYLLSWTAFIAIMQLLGGGGSTIGLGIDTFIFAKSERYKAQGKLQLIPCIFNISEPALFGMPIILNPIFFIPFVLGPMAIYLLFYLCLKIGIFTTPVVVLNNFLPGAIQGFLMGGGIGLGIFMIIATALSCLIWLPFVLIADKAELKNEQNQAE